MINETNIANLQRLTRGKFKLDKAAMETLIKEIQSISSDELLSKIFPEKIARKRTPPKPKPEWLQEMLNARKKLAWSAKEATEKLFEIAEEHGLELSKAKQKSFPKAAEQIAEKLGEKKTQELFVKWVADFADSHQMA